MVNAQYDRIVYAISAGIRIDVAKVITLAAGRVYTGKQAHELGLVDGIGNYYDALAGTGNMVGLGDNPKLKAFESNKVKWQSIFGAEIRQIFQTEIITFIKNSELGDRIPRAEG